MFSGSHNGAAPGAAGAASKPGITQGLQQDAACSVRRHVAVALVVLLILFAVCVGTVLLDETHVLGVNPEVTGCQHLRRLNKASKREAR